MSSLNSNKRKFIHLQIPTTKTTEKILFFHLIALVSSFELFLLLIKSEEKQIIGVKF